VAHRQEILAQSLRTYREALADTDEQDAARMLYFALWPSGDELHSYSAGLAALQAAPAMRDEMRQVMDLSFSKTSTVAVELDRALGELPLRVHASYRRDEILAGLGWATLDRFVKGHWFLPIGGHGTCPLAATVSARWRPRSCPPAALA
jgi:hypothetical protein